MGSRCDSNWKLVLKEHSTAFNAEVESLLQAVMDNQQQVHQEELTVLESAHARQFSEMESQVTQLNEQLTTTVRTYNEVITELSGKLDAAQVRLAASELARSEQVSRLNNQIQQDDDQLKQTLDDHKQIITDLTKQLEMLKRQGSDRDNNHQRQRLILIQTNDQLKAENDELRRQLSAAAQCKDDPDGSS